MLSNLAFFYKFWHTYTYMYFPLTVYFIFVVNTNPENRLKVCLWLLVNRQNAHTYSPFCMAL